MTGEDLNRHVHHMNLRTWLENEAAELGTDVQRVAYSRGQLSESELRRLAREALFSPLVEAVKEKVIKRWAPLEWHDVQHEKSACINPVGFSQDIVTHTMWFTRNGSINVLPTPFELPETNASLERLLDLVRRAANHPWLERSHEAFRATVYRHTAKCHACHGRADRLSLYVETDWAGRTLTQEYAL